jgi:hypothetical protein
MQCPVADREAFERNGVQRFYVSPAGRVFPSAVIIAALLRPRHLARRGSGAQDAQGFLGPVSRRGVRSRR